MTSFDDTLERVLRDEGWDVSGGPVDGSLLAEADGERVLVTWRRTDADTGRPRRTLQAAAEPADAGDATAERTEAADDAEGDPSDEVPVVRLRVDADEAAEEAHPKLVEIEESVLELAPHVAYKYTARVPDGTGDAETYRGHVLRSGVSDAVLTLEAPRFSDGVPKGARPLDAEVDPASAATDVREHLVDTYTRDVQVETGDGNVSMMETRRVSPEDDGIALEEQGTWYVPVWRLEGENGTVHVDANRGEVIDEDLEDETATDAEWVV